jgi:hypothetical protein
MFVSKLSQLIKSNTANLKIDDGTVAKIEELFINRKNANDYDIVKESHRQENINDEKVAPSLSEYKSPEYLPGRDTFKDEPISFDEYQ